MILSELMRLPSEISQVCVFELGCDLSIRSNVKSKDLLVKNRQIAWTATFASQRDYMAYRDHPAHLAFLALLKPHVEPGTRSAIQYEIK